MNKQIAITRNELIDERTLTSPDIPLNYTYVRGERWLWTPDYENDLNATWTLFCELPDGYSITKHGLMQPNGEIICDDIAYAVCKAWMETHNMKERTG